MKRGEWDIPDYELEAIVKCFLPDVQQFFATEEGKEYLEEYKSVKKQKTQQGDKRLKTQTRSGNKTP